MTGSRDKDLLRRWLQIALELELATIPPYLTALISIRLPGNREAASLIRGVVIEEMLHLALVANVLNAVGGTPRIKPDTIPSYPLQMTFEGKPFDDRRFLIDLAAFSPETIATFLEIERPESPAHPKQLLDVTLDVPSLTIGGFYQEILALMTELAAKGEAALFDGAFDRQVATDFYWGGGGALSVVTDLASARTALLLVISQGEGAWRPAAGEGAADFSGPQEMGHYFRFNEIAFGRRYMPTDDPDQPPTGPSIDVDYRAVDIFRPNPKSDDYVGQPEMARANALFNQRYTQLLRQLGQAFDGYPRALYSAINDGMRGLAPLAHEMMKTPMKTDPKGRGCCPTFEWLDAESSNGELDIPI